VLLLGLLLGPGGAAGQQPAEDVYYTRELVFRIPFEPDPGERRIRQVQLYVSQDRGRSWQAHVIAQPDQRYFNFQAQRDGLYWFAVQTTDHEGRVYPARLDDIRPQLKVAVDSQPPALTLRALSPREGEAGVEWDVRDDHLDHASLRLEYRLPGSADWQPLAGNLPAAGQKFWTPGTNGTLEVRLQARDLAGNANEAKTPVTPGPAAPGGSTARSPQGPPGQGVRPGTPTVQMVNSKTFSLSYNITDKGPSGISEVEVWYTDDSRTWQKYQTIPKPEAPYAVEVTVQDEKLYGFTLVVKSGVGLGDQAPRINDPPQMWVEVDLRKPVVKVHKVDVPRDPQNRSLTILWKATDKNLARQPITLSYALEAEGPWHKIAANLENTERYIWQMPPDVPYRFLVRVEAVDQAGNVGSDQTVEHVLVDLAQPKAQILGVAPSGAKN
jgi:hypothetical protein